MENQIQRSEHGNAICGVEMFQGYPDVLNLEEMSELLQISTKTGRLLLNNGEIRSFRIGRSSFSMSNAAAHFVRRRSLC